MAGADLFWEKSTAGWLLVAGLFWEKSTAGWWLISRTNRLRTISFYIFDNALILPIRPLNTTVRQLKNQSYSINLNHHIFTYMSFFYYIRVIFQPVVYVILCAVKTPFYCRVFSYLADLYGYNIITKTTLWSWFTFISLFSQILMFYKI
jgi:hypothetical protein